MSAQTDDEIPPDILSLFNGLDDLPEFRESSENPIPMPNMPFNYNDELSGQRVEIVYPSHSPQEPLITGNTNYPYHSPSNHSSESGFVEGSERSPWNNSFSAQSPFDGSSSLLSPSNNSSFSASPHSSINGEHPLQHSIHGSSDETNKHISINIQKGTKKYRHAKEMKIGHGGLKGEIGLPRDYETNNYRIILSTVPSEESNQKIHPCMLHVTVMNQGSKQKRATYRTQLTSPQDWRLILDVECGKVFYIPNYGKVNERYEIDCLRNGRIILGENNLQLTIISPLQGKKQADGIKLAEVIQTRIIEEQWNINRTAEQIANAYTSVKASRIDLHRCRLRAQIYRRSFSSNQNMNSYHIKVDEDISEDIIDNGDQNVGSFDLECMSEPNGCCTKGEGKIILISKYKVATVGKDNNGNERPPVFPVFVFVDTDGTVFRPENIWPNFQQICITSDNLTIHGGAFTFRVPPQNYEIIKHMRNSQRKLKLALYRSLDGIYSDTTFDFIYHSCFEGCPFCIIRQLHQSGNTYTTGKSINGCNKKRRRISSTQDFMLCAGKQMDWSQDAVDQKRRTKPTTGIDTIDLEDLSDIEDMDDNEPSTQYKEFNFRRKIIADSVDEDHVSDFGEDDIVADNVSDVSSDEASFHMTSSHDEEEDNSEYGLPIKVEDMKPTEEVENVVQVLTEKLDSVDKSKPTESIADQKEEGLGVCEERKENLDNRRRSRQIMINIVLIVISIIIGWIAGFCSSNYEPVLTVIAGGAICGVIIGWCYNDLP